MADFTTIKNPGLHFNTKLYSGSNSSQSVTGVGFQPDWVWMKQRGGATDHKLADAVRGANKNITSNSTAAETTHTYFTSFDSDGFTLDGNVSDYNKSGLTYVSWNWKAGGAGSSNNDGSIASTVSANTTAGFSIVSYAGNSAAGATVGHGLGSAPTWIIGKNRTDADSWFMYHGSLGGGSTMSFNNSNAKDNNTAFWNNTSPSNTVFTLGNSTDANETGKNYIAYCFAEKRGYSKFGSYTGNGSSNGPFVFCGFKPAFVIARRTDSGSSWQMYDNKRDVDNVVTHRLRIDLNNAEDTGNVDVDFLSNGWKLRNTGINQNGGAYIFMAFAEEPLVGDNPTTAR